ncbi:Fimbrial assembly protein (PilN) [Desulfosporosinus acidiphilus SJ4]|uniref:Fimbrial assembly protein (PilN) n=1 Tax=Desulfosporosinus acidiphilus (strain DSM 22704 / JCM 16185 / SJ4) TaxID=646529 RepID=I4D947_DESAJ|nr:PilN domain-containing protein [Desulfosporosinus acidiphilus]AFM42321.1 Fimbrial assembly protein (PilN) [Desulfosporosinus acidiphilus SJ4]
MKEKNEFNFAQRWVTSLARESNGPSKFKTQAVIWGIVGLMIFGIIGSTPWLWDYKLARDINKAEENISSLREISTQVSKMNALKKEVQEEQQTLNTIQKSTHDPGSVLDKLKGMLPIGTIINSFALQENSVALSVSVPNPVDVARLWVSLRDSGMFQEVNLQNVSLQDKVQSLNLNLLLK